MDLKGKTTNSFGLLTDKLEVDVNNAREFGTRNNLLKTLTFWVDYSKIWV